MLPEQVSDDWDFFAQAIASSLPPGLKATTGVMVNILLAVLEGRLAVWVYVSDNAIKAVLSTHVLRDQVSKTQNLLLYSFTSISGMLDEGDWNVMLYTLSEYGKSNGCNTALAYTNNQKITQFLSNRGADVSQTLIQMRL